MKFSPSILLLAMAPLLLSACRSDPAIEPSGKTVRIGVIAPLSGSDHALGKSGLQGVKLALKLQPLLNNGDRLELVVVDDETDPLRAEAALDELAEKQVVAVLALSKSNGVLELQDRARRHKLPIIATVATHPDLTTSNPHLVQLSFDDAFQATVAAMFLRDELLLDRAAVIYEPDDPHSRFLAEEFARRFEEANGRMVERSALASVEPVLADHLGTLRDQDVELLYLPMQAAGVLRVAGALGEGGWSPVVMAADGLLSEILLNHAEDLHLVDGLIATDIHSSILPRTAYGEEVWSAYSEQKSKSGSTFTVLASEAASILHDSLNRCDRPYASRDVQRALRSTRQFEGFTGTIAIGSDGKAIRPVYVNTIRGKTLEFIVKVY